MCEGPHYQVIAFKDTFTFVGRSTWLNISIEQRAFCPMAQLTDYNQLCHMAECPLF